MGKCEWNSRVERWFDGAETADTEISTHLETCGVCTAYLSMLKRLRGGAAAVAKREEIRDPQFHAFMEGIRNRVEGAPAGRRLGWWTLSSVAAAALIVAIFTFMVVTGGPAAVRAQTTVESASTDLDGATAEVYSSENGTATVWVNIPRGDVW
ncbi:MAG: hypothetical protein HZB26_00310 [Candidatus Hydrogenedentes bacterium]|nr:hypothetical protein [Candidatus Hydrogenedentota bacterium]